MQTITIRCDDQMAEHLFLILQNLKGVDIAPKETKKGSAKSLRGVFQEYADTSKRAMEADAWKTRAVNRYANND